MSSYHQCKFHFRFWIFLCFVLFPLKTAPNLFRCFHSNSLRKTRNSNLACQCCNKNQLNTLQFGLLMGLEILHHFDCCLDNKRKGGSHQSLQFTIVSFLSFVLQTYNILVWIIKLLIESDLFIITLEVMLQSILH